MKDNMHGTMDSVRFCGKSKRDLEKYLEFEVPSYEMGEFILTAFLLFNAVGVPTALCGLWKNITFGLLVIIIPLDIWAILIISMRKKFYKQYTVFIGIYMTIISFFILLGTIKFTNSYFKLSIDEVLPFLLIAYFLTIFGVFVSMAIFLQIGYYGEKGKLKPPKILIGSSIGGISLAIAISRTIDFPVFVLWIMVGFIAGLCAASIHKILQYYLMKKFDMIPKYMGDGNEKERKAYQERIKKAQKAEAQYTLEKKKQKKAGGR